MAWFLCKIISFIFVAMSTMRSDASSVSRFLHSMRIFTSIFRFVPKVGRLKKTCSFLFSISYSLGTESDIRVQSNHFSSYSPSPPVYYTQTHFRQWAPGWVISRRRKSLHVICILNDGAAAAAQSPLSLKRSSPRCTSGFSRILGNIFIAQISWNSVLLFQTYHWIRSDLAATSKSLISYVIIYIFSHLFWRPYLGNCCISPLSTSHVSPLL